MADNVLPSPFLSRVDSRQKRDSEAPPSDEEQIAAGDAYAAIVGPRQALALKYIRRDGRIVTVPYAYLPLLWLQPAASLLLVEYPGLFTVALRGSNLTGLEARITERRVTWVRECSEAEAVCLPLAVTRIDILRVYPSREDSLS